jgi:Mrp family chromosome partitioning ATPase/predicted Fe-Mo cluster-binding NifX family protein
MSDDNLTIGSCPSADNSANQEKFDFSAKLHEMSKVKKVIGVISGKGGVGKSLVTSLLAVYSNQKGFKTAIMDADITGPSIPKAFGIKEKAVSQGLGLFPVKSKTGIDIMSINCLLDNETDPVIWRGPLVANVVKQFWSDVIWDDIDYMFIDMPPGTGDVALTTFQSLPVDGIIVVTSPQELVSMIVSKAVNMAKMMNIPILGLVENMSYFKCPDCNKEHYIYGKSHIDEIAEKFNLNVIAKLPIDPDFAQAVDAGNIEELNHNWFDNIHEFLDTKKEYKMKIAVASELNQVAGHFGHCSNFNIFETENEQIISSESIPNPGHKPGFLPVFLHEKGVKVIISGGMGGAAVELFNEKGIEVIVGAAGDAKEQVARYLKGELKSTGSVCHEHQHHHECGNH